MPRNIPLKWKSLLCSKRQFRASAISGKKSTLLQRSGIFISSRVRLHSNWLKDVSASSLNISGRLFRRTRKLFLKPSGAIYAKSYAQEGAMRAAFEMFKTFDIQDAADNR